MEKLICQKQNTKEILSTNCKMTKSVLTTFLHSADELFHGFFSLQNEEESAGLLFKHQEFCTVKNYSDSNVTSILFLVDLRWPSVGSTWSSTISTLRPSSAMFEIVLDTSPLPQALPSEPLLCFRRLLFSNILE